MMNQIALRFLHSVLSSISAGYVEGLVGLTDDGVDDMKKGERTVWGKSNQPLSRDGSPITEVKSSWNSWLLKEITRAGLRGV